MEFFRVRGGGEGRGRQGAIMGDVRFANRPLYLHVLFCQWRLRDNTLQNCFF